MEQNNGPRTSGKVGMVLEGGAMRGMYTAGVLDVMMENGFGADLIIGVSAGAIHGCNLVSGQPGRSIRYYQKYRGDRHFMGLYSLLTTGDVVGKKFCYEEIPLHLDPFDEAAFEASPTDFYVTVTNVETGEPEYILCDELRVGGKMDVVRAGASMPLCSHIVEYGGKKYLDGGIADSIPYAKAKQLGAEKCVVVLTQPAGYLKEPANLAPFRVVYRKYPKLVEAMGRRHMMYNTEVCAVEQAAQRGEAFLIRPSKNLKIGRMEKDMARLRAMYDLGRSDAAEQMPALNAYLNGETAQSR
ncbi:MAG: patatin family protein [Gemmiger sp.]